MAKGLTTKQELFRNAVLRGMTPRAAAESAGYSNPASAAWEQMRHPKVRESIYSARQSAIESDLAGYAIEAMRELTRGGVYDMNPDTGEAEFRPTVPAATRYQASKWILEHAGHGRSEDASDAVQTPVDQLTGDQLADVVNNGMQALGELAQQLNGQHYIDGEARPVRDLPAGPPDDPPNDESDDINTAFLD